LLEILKYIDRHLTSASSSLPSVAGPARRPAAVAGVTLEATRLGNLGDTKSVGKSVREMRIHIGSGYRVYFALRRKVVILLLCGGTKSTQSRDIQRAQKMLSELDSEK
jgi:putative addiction module killer protein